MLADVGVHVRVSELSRVMHDLLVEVVVSLQNRQHSATHSVHKPYCLVAHIHTDKYSMNCDIKFHPRACLYSANYTLGHIEKLFTWLYLFNKMCIGMLATKS